jgi:hypothetical protein
LLRGAKYSTARRGVRANDSPAPKSLIGCCVYEYTP